VVVKHPQVLGLALENMEEHVEFLLNKVGVREAKLEKVRYCLLFAYTCCKHFHASRVHRRVNKRRFVGMVTKVRSPPNLLIWL
jgi:hypothetical protein